MNLKIKINKKTKDLIIAIGLLLIGYFFGDTVVKINKYSPVKIPATVEEVNSSEVFKKYTSKKEDAGSVNQEELENLKEKNKDLKTATVKYVIDGDTIVLTNGEKVRFVSVDTPERGQCWYRQAKEMTRDLLGGKTIRLEIDKSNRDRYQRLLRYVYVKSEGEGEIFVNMELVKAGLARAKRYKPDVRLYDELKKAENFAKLNKVGLWGGCEE